MFFVDVIDEETEGLGKCEDLMLAKRGLYPCSIDKVDDLVEQSGEFHFSWET